jgi:preprotein translocase subunit SecF
MIIITHKNVFFTISTVFVVCAALSIAYFGLRPGIDFAGGSVTELTYTDTRPETSVIVASLESAGFSGSVVRETGERSVSVRTAHVSDDDTHAVLRDALSLGGTASYEETNFTFVGPAVGGEMTRKAWIAIVAVIGAIILFIAFAFRQVSKPVSSWVYGSMAIVALVHDVIVPAGAFAAMGALFPGYEIDVLFVTALLSILGFSIHDTIVIFDRVRENLKRDTREHTGKTFAETVGDSLRETITRSINTSLTVLVVVAVLFFVGSPAIRPFAFTLFVGIIAGTYSSVFLAAPLLVLVNDMREKREMKKKK